MFAGFTKISVLLSMFFLLAACGGSGSSGLVNDTSSGGGAQQGNNNSDVNDGSDSSNNSDNDEVSDNTNSDNDTSSDNDGGDENDAGSGDTENRRPTLTLNGSELISLTVGEEYQELGATAQDPEDGDISENIIIDSSAVDISESGSYLVTYNVTDSEMLAAVELVRTVNVVEEISQNQAPVITLLGANEIAINVNDSYEDPGASAFDAEDGDISSDISIDTSLVDTSVPGAYTVTYNVIDSQELAAIQVTRTVVVIAENFASCTGQTGTAVAINFDYVTARNASRPTMLSATSEDIEFNEHSVDDYPNIAWSRRYKAYKYGDGGGAITQWILAATPLNGALYEAGVLLAQDDTISDPDDLMYVPDKDFVGQDFFFYCAADASGLSNTARVDITVADPANYPMPLGVPHPGFGLNEFPPADPAEWPNAESSGFYYIDGSDPNCSNDNDFGYPAVPRCSFSSGTTVGGGKKMVIAGTTELRDSSWHLINFTGSDGNPAWLVGDDRAALRPTIVPDQDRSSRTTLRITGGYFRISGLSFDGLGIDHRGAGESATSTHQAVIRHSEVKNNPSTGGGGTTVGLSTDGEGVLAWNVYAHDNGIVNETLERERDIHAFVGSNQQGYWMLDISCSENAGDCVQLTNRNSSENVYVGRMAGHSEGENCIDIKDNNKVVVSESDCWDLRRVEYGNSGGNAQAFYVNDEGEQQAYVWFINNRSWDSGGIHYGAANVGGRVYFIGNRAFFGPADGINFSAGGGERHALFNTLVDTRRGIYHFGAGSSDDRYIVGNAVIGASQYQTRLQSATGVIDMLDYNFYSDTNGLFATGGSSPNNYHGLAAFNAATGFDENGMEGISPMFVDAELYDFSIMQGSEMIDAIPAHVIDALPAIQALSDDLGISLTDFNGTNRHQGMGFDVGADESSH